MWPKLSRFTEFHAAIRFEVLSRVAVIEFFRLVLFFCLTHGYLRAIMKGRQVLCIQSLSKLRKLFLFDLTFNILNKLPKFNLQMLQL